MLRGQPIWLAVNQGSGSNSPAGLAALEESFARAGCRLERKMCIPEDPLPDRRSLAQAGVGLLAIFTGDGTISSIVPRLYGWDGAVLVLPGGTMNLLSARLHGEAEAADIIARVAAGAARIRPAIIRSRHGDGLTGMLAGPGTAWNEVREAIRSTDVVELVSSTTGAIQQSTSGTTVFCEKPRCGREEGYPAIMLTPREQGIECDGFYADSVADYLQQGLALLRRDFRDGPHEPLGTFPQLRLTSTVREPMGLLIDGESVDGGVSETFTLARCEVDLLATAGTPG